MTVNLVCLALLSISGIHLFVFLSFTNHFLSPPCRFGVRPLPKRQMILKLKEIHQYTHQLVSSDSEDDAPPAGRTAQVKPPSTSSVAVANRLVSSARTVKFKEPRAPAAVSPLKQPREEEAELLSASQGSNTSSTAASEESDRYSVFKDRLRCYVTAHFSCCTFVLLLYIFTEGSINILYIIRQIFMLVPQNDTTTRNAAARSVFRLPVWSLIL